MEFIQNNLGWMATTLTTLLILPIVRLFQRVHQLETKQEGAATKADLARLEVKLAEVKGDVKETKAELKAMHHQFGIFMQSYLDKEL